MTCRAYTWSNCVYIALFILNLGKTVQTWEGLHWKWLRKIKTYTFVKKTRKTPEPFFFELSRFIFAARNLCRGKREQLNLTNRSYRGLRVCRPRSPELQLHFWRAAPQLRQRLQQSHRASVTPWRGYTSPLLFQRWWLWLVRLAAFPPGHRCSSASFFTSHLKICLSSLQNQNCPHNEWTFFRRG